MPELVEGIISSMFIGGFDKLSHHIREFKIYFSQRYIFFYINTKILTYLCSKRKKYDKINDRLW